MNSARGLGAAAAVEEEEEEALVEAEEEVSVAEVRAAMAEKKSETNERWGKK